MCWLASHKTAGGLTRFWGAATELNLTRVRAHIYTPMCTCKDVHTHSNTHTDMHTTHTLTRTYTDVHTHTPHAHEDVHIYTYVHRHAHIHGCAHTHSHTHRHAHTLPHPRTSCSLLQAELSLAKSSKHSHCCSPSGLRTGRRAAGPGASLP